MATAQFGILKEFCPDSESVKVYLERVQLYFEANEVPEEKQVPILLSTIGSSTYTLLSDLLAPAVPKSKTLTEITAILRRHYEPKRAVIAERFHFHKRDQAMGESIADYDAALRKLATHCKFEGYLEDALRDRFVCGLRNEAMQRRLLGEADLTYSKAMELAQAMEAAEENARSLKGAETAIRRVQGRLPHRTQAKHPCTRCGKPGHTSQNCRFRDAECHACGKKGHIASACRSKSQARSLRKGTQSAFRNKTRPQGTHELHQEKQATENTDSEAKEFPLFKFNEPSSNPIEIQVKINDQCLTMEVDTGAAVSIISNSTRKKLFPRLKLQPSKLVLKTYTDEQMQIVGQLNVYVQYGEQRKPLALVVVSGDGPSLFGRNWLKYIRLDWHRIATVRTKPQQLQTLLQEYQSLFKDELGTVQPYRATLHVQPNAKPKFFKPRPVPFAIRDAIGQELDRLEEQGIIKRVDHSEWAAPIVAVPKKDGRFRLCGDYKVTINQALEVDQYPIPNPEELFTTLAKGTLFSKLDLSQAYLQVQLDESSTPFVTINTHRGLYQPTRLPFGVASAPAMFQKLMDTVLKGIPGVICYIDDILVTGATQSDHLRNLEQVFQRLERSGFRLKKEKCTFLANSVQYLGHQIDHEGIRALPSKTEAIVNAPAPTGVRQLRSFLGLLNYYGKFIRNLSSIIHPLNTLLQANHTWKWTQECAEAFRKAKDQLASAKVLVHYVSTLPIIMAADASAHGVGAVLSHVFPDGSEKPIAFASRTLTPSERNYAQLEKEALSLIFGVKKFHRYLYGRKFKLVTDHKPLTAILGPKKGIPSLAAARLQRWAILLSAYDYEVVFKPTQVHCNADGLSRLPLPAEDPASNSEEVSVFNVAQVQALPVTFQQIRSATRRDPVLSKVTTYARTGWPDKVPEVFKPYHSRQHEIGLESGCLMWGIRVIVPRSLQRRVLESLHEAHPGATRMKAVARSYLWWSGLDKDIEDQAKACLACQEQKSSPAVAPLHPWIWPTAPWKRVHVDFAGPFLDKMFLVIVDAHSKWPEVIPMSSTTAPKTIAALQTLFAKYGLPEQLVSDNGPQFSSEEFAHFTKANGIKHIYSAPYHPSSNGLAERFVQTFKRAMKAGAKDGNPLNVRLAQFLLCYRSTPHATTDLSPSELFLQRKIRTRLDLLKPDVETLVASKQACQKKHHDSHAKYRQLSPGQLVMARDFRSTSKWIPGAIVDRTGPLSYTVKLGNGKIIRRHIDQLRDRSTPLPETSTGTTTQVFEPFQDYHHCELPTQSPPPDPVTPVRRYPQRERRPPDRFVA